MSQVLPHREVARNFGCECEVQGLQFFSDYKDLPAAVPNSEIATSAVIRSLRSKWIKTGDARAELGRGEFGDISLAKLALVERTSGRRRRLVLRASKTGDGRDPIGKYFQWGAHRLYNARGVHFRGGWRD